MNNNCSWFHLPFSEYPYVQRKISPFIVILNKQEDFENFIISSNAVVNKIVVAIDLNKIIIKYAFLNNKTYKNSEFK